ASGRACVTSSKIMTGTTGASERMERVALASCGMAFPWAWQSRARVRRPDRSAQDDSLKCAPKIPRFRAAEREEPMVQTINAVTPLADARAILAQDFDLEFSPGVKRATAPIFERVRD